MVMEERVSRLEGAYEQVDKRLDDLKQEITSFRGEMRGEIGSLRNDIGSLRDETRREIGSLRNDIGSMRDEMRSDNESLRNEMRSADESLRNDLNNRVQNIYLLLFGSWLTLIGMMVGLFFRG